MIQRIFALDPGMTCGIAQLYVLEDKPAMISQAFEIQGTPGEIYKAFHNWFDPLKDGKPIIIIEDWDFRSGTPADARLACYPAGWLQMLAYEYGIEVVMQRPQFRLGIPDTKELTPDTWWLPPLHPGHEHRRQALRHALAYLVFTQHHLMTLRHLRPMP